MKIPKSKKDIKAKLFINFQNYMKNNKDSEAMQLKNMIKIFYEIDNDKFNTLTYPQILDMKKIIENIIKTPSKLIQKFKINDKIYGINPNFNDTKFNEFMDLETDDIIRQICILYRPIIKEKGKNYLIEEYKADISSYDIFKEEKGKNYLIEEYQADISSYDIFKEELTLDIYLGFISFFLTIYKKLMNNTVQSLGKDLTDLQLEQKEIFQKNMDGMLGYINYVTGI